MTPTRVDLRSGGERRSTRVVAGLGLWQDRDPLEALATARLIDELGYPELWIGEMATFDAFALGMAVARETTSVPLCLGPLAVAVRDPMAMAMGVASVSALAGGRAVALAIGSSSPVVVAGWHGRRWERTALALRETVAALRPLLAGEKADVRGELVGSIGYRLRLPPPPTSVTVAAFGPGAVRVAAQTADRMVLNLVTPASVARLVTALHREAADAGREAPPVACWLTAAVDPTEQAHAQLRGAVAGYLAAPGYGEMFAEAGFGGLVAEARSGELTFGELVARIPPQLPAAVGLVGSLDEVRARAAQYVAAGVDELVILPATAGDDAGERTLRALAGLELAA